MCFQFEYMKRKKLHLIVFFIFVLCLASIIFYPLAVVKLSDWQYKRDAQKLMPIVQRIQTEWEESGNWLSVEQVEELVVVSNIGQNIREIDYYFEIDENDRTIPVICATLRYGRKICYYFDDPHFNHYRYKGWYYLDEGYRSFSLPKDAL